MSDNNRRRCCRLLRSPTNGHIDISERATLLKVSWSSPTTAEDALSPPRAHEMLRTILSSQNIEVVSHRGLVVDFAPAHGWGGHQSAALVDFAMSSSGHTNKQLNPDLEVLFMPTSLSISSCALTPSRRWRLWCGHQPDGPRSSSR